jgi:hypothetical protein
MIMDKIKTLAILLLFITLIKQVTKGTILEPFIIISHLIIIALFAYYQDNKILKIVIIFAGVAVLIGESYFFLK